MPTTNQEDAISAAPIQEETTGNQSKSRCSAAEIRQAAGSQSPARLQAALKSGWNCAQELDTAEAFTKHGKSALQMAAWKGCLENVQYLVETTVGCNVNAYSQAPFSYGKTPIFFAVTQSRPEIVEYLLRRPEIQVAIVNNKGQSVMSLAASHDMPHWVLHRIQQLEEGQEWWNFRQSHSDGLEYGDLDPRFLDRSLRETDVVTCTAINPTTPLTRKGGFARRNPEAAKEKEKLIRRNQKERKKNTKTKLSTTLSLSEEQEWKQAWIRLEAVCTCERVSASRRHFDHDATLLTIIRLGEKQRCPWMPKLLELLSMMWDIYSIDDWDVVIQRTMALAQQHDDSNRLETLLDKLLRRLRCQDPRGQPKDRELQNQESNGQQNPGRSSSTNRAWKMSLQQAEDLLQSDLGKQMRQSISDLSIRQGLEHGDSSILRLSVPPIFVNNIAQILELQKVLETATVVAIDTEWFESMESEKHTPGSTGVQISTFQLAFVTADPCNATPTYVIDLKHRSVHDESPIGHDDDYRMLARELISSLMEDSRRVILGFSVGHDLPVIERFIERKLQPTSLLDLQTVLGKNQNQSGSSLPSLKACAAHYSQVPLSKEEQCSDWGRRPLSHSQLNYAGLDAAILLFLLAEYIATSSK